MKLSTKLVICCVRWTDEANDAHSQAGLWSHYIEPSKWQVF